MSLAKFPPHPAGYQFVNGDSGPGSSNNCACCPYGYHIDLDFIKYCEQLNNSSPTEGQLRRTSRRRQRQSMEVMLGLQQQAQRQQLDFNLAEQLLREVHDELRNANEPPTPPPRAHHSESPIVPYYSRHPPFHQKAATPMQNFYTAFVANDNALNDVVSDFERTLERSSKKSKSGERRSYSRTPVPLEQATHDTMHGKWLHPLTIFPFD